MSDKISFHICSRQADHMNTAIATEARDIVWAAAEPVRPGELVKTQMRRSWENLGRPAWWRLKAAWYGEAGSFSAAAIADLQNRYTTWKASEARRAQQAAATRELIRNNGRRAAVENARAEIDNILARIEHIEAALRAPGPDPIGAWYRQERLAAGDADSALGEAPVQGGDR